MITIHKFELTEYGQKFTVEMPDRAEILHVGCDARGTMFVWAIVNTDMPMCPRRFYIAGTGHEFPVAAIERKHHGTVQVGAFVWHVFEVFG